MQVAVQGGAIDTGNQYAWVDFNVSNNPIGSGSFGETGGAGWGCGVTTGGGTGAQWWSRGHIYLDFYSASDFAAVGAHWDMLQINAGVAIRRIGAGYYSANVGPLTKVHCFATNGSFAAGTTFDLLVSK
jgi:hypothetical protein